MGDHHNNNYLALLINRLLGQLECKKLCRTPELDIEIIKCKFLLTFSLINVFHGLKIITDNCLPFPAQEKVTASIVNINANMNNGEDSNHV